VNKGGMVGKTNKSHYNLSKRFKTASIYQAVAFGYGFELCASFDICIKPTDYFLVIHTPL